MTGPSVKNLDNEPPLPKQEMPATIAEAREITIPLPAGYLAAKIWGKLDGEPVLAIHGWLDNAASFDRLLPLINKNYYVVAIDLPGHGKSSHNVAGAFYHHWEFGVLVKRVADYFQWKKFSAIGHSYGGWALLLFAALFPEQVDKLVLMDVMMPPVRTELLHRDRAKQSIVEHFALEKKSQNKPQPAYKEDDIIKRLKAARDFMLTTDTAKVLLSRGATVDEETGHYTFSHDPRFMLTNLHCFTLPQYLDMLSYLRCELLIIKARQGYDYLLAEQKEAVLQLYKKVCTRFEFVLIEGNHNVHLNIPRGLHP